MKKVFTYIIFALSLLSCQDKMEQPDPVPAAIAFSSPGIEAKSILIEDKSQLAIGGDALGYSVFAARYIPSDAGEITRHEQFMDNVKVSSTDEGLMWGYDADPDKEGQQQFYWSPGAVHKFFAVYPYFDSQDDTYDQGISYFINEEVHALQVSGKHSVAGSSLICTGIDADGKNLCPDILYGVQFYPEPYSVSVDRAPVRFTLSHALSAVSFRIRNASEYNISKVQTQAITGFENASEYVRLSDEGALWGPLHTVSDHTFKVPEITSSVSSGDYYPASESECWYTALMIPQNFGVKTVSPSFTFTVTFAQNTIADKTYTLNFKDYQVQSNAEHAFSFLPGCHYVYTINVTSSVISCHVDVVPWIEDEPIKLN